MGNILTDEELCRLEAKHIAEGLGSIDCITLFAHARAQAESIKRINMACDMFEKNSADAATMWEALIQIARFEPYQHSPTCLQMHRIANQAIETVSKPAQSKIVWELECCTDFREANQRAHEGWEVITVLNVTPVYGPHGESIREGFTEWHFKRKVTKS